jgi:RHS repeat-associated protein
VSAAAYYEPPNSQPRSTPAGSGSPCEKETRSSTCWADHVSASLPQARPASRRTRAGRRYLRCATSRGARGATPTTFKFTGQRQETEIGLYFYNARWYDAALGRFVQADPVVPVMSQGVQAFDRYAYVNNNPVRYTDPNGNCIERATDTCITWDNPFGQQQVGNTCAVASMALAISIVLDTRVIQADIQVFYPNTYIGIGVVPPQQPTAAVIDPRVRATFAQGNRADLENNVRNGNPTVVSFTVAGWGVGHAVVVVGENTATGELIFWDPQNNNFWYENQILARYNAGRGFQNFDALWADSNLFIPASPMVTVEPVELTIGVSSPSSARGGGWGNLGVNRDLSQ